MIEVDPKEFLKALERVAIIAKETEYQAVDLLFADNNIKISAFSPEDSKAEQTR